MKRIVPYSMCLLPALPWVGSYLQLNLGIILALMALPFVWHVEPGKLSARYGWLAASFWGLHLLMGNNLWLWLALGTALLFGLEWQGKRVGWLPLGLLGLLSPVMTSWMQVCSFPLQLRMSQLVGSSLSLLGANVQVLGNRFYYAGQWFEVESACLGVHTLTLSLVATMLLLGMTERKWERRWSLVEVSMWSVLAILLAMFANYIRTLCLVVFHSPADTLGHELVGLVTILLLVVLPLAVLLKLTLQRMRSTAFSKALPTRSRLIWLPLPLLLLISGTALSVYLKPVHSLDANGLSPTWPSLQQDTPSPGVRRFHSDEVLIYLKAPVSAWRADHTPQVCWRGSGYRFAHIRAEDIGGLPVMRGILIRQTDTLHTAWGYHNGDTALSGAWEWRMAQLKGESPFSLWNITTSRAKELEQAVVEHLPALTTTGDSPDF